MADFDVATTILLFLEKICYNDLFGFSPSFICFHPLFAWKTNVSIVAPFTFKRNNEYIYTIYIYNSNLHEWREMKPGNRDER